MRMSGKPVAVVVMGTSGTGKTTVAKGLSERLGWPFAEADDFHSPENIAKMSAGTPLNDADRWPWLHAIRDWITAEARAGRNVVVTCSALKRSYRDILREADADVRFAFLTGDPALIAARMGRRTGHFMPASLLASQLADLEALGPDESGAAIEVDAAPDQIVSRAIDRLGLAGKVTPASV